MKIDESKCISCGECYDVCPHQAVEVKPAKGGGYGTYCILDSKCQNCGTCLDVCAGDAIGD